MSMATASRSVLPLLAIRLLLPAVFGSLLAAQTSVEALHQRFQNPPDDARIMMRWWWFGAAVTKEQLGREMRLMKDGGIGGFEVQPVYAVAFDDEERGIENLSYMSEEFLDALRFTAEEAKRLGLRFDLTLGSGWPYGGPHIPISQSSGALRIDRAPIPNNSRRIALPDLREGEKLLAAFALSAQQIEGEIGRGGRRGPPSYRSTPEGIRRLTDFRDGALWVPQGVSSGQKVWFFVSSRTGKLVERSAVDADGFIHDHYRRDALETHLREVGAPLLRALGREHLPYAIFCDSLEVDNSDWTPALLEEFQKRRGYDLTPHLPALGAELGPSTRALRRDWAKTLTELLHGWLEGPIREAAVIHVNGKRAGSVWSPPYAVDVTALLRPGPNHMRIEVANLAINYKAGQPLPNYRLLNLRYGERFTDQDMDKITPQPAGILGPVRLIADGAR